MPAHGMPHNGLPLHIRRKVRGDDIRQLTLDIILHPIMRIKGRCGGVYVKSGTQAKVICGIDIIGNTFAARAGVRRHENQTQLCTCAAEFAFLGHICMGAGQARQKPYHWQNLAFFVRRDID